MHVEQTIRGEFWPTREYSSVFTSYTIMDPMSDYGPLAVAPFATTQFAANIVHNALLGSEVD
jgi:hypothetical protein